MLASMDFSFSYIDKIKKINSNQIKDLIKKEISHVKTFFKYSHVVLSCLKQMVSSVPEKSNKTVSSVWSKLFIYSQFLFISLLSFRMLFSLS